MVDNIRVNNLIVDIIDSFTLIEYKIDNPDQIPKAINISNGLFALIDFNMSTSDFLKRKKIMLRKLIMLR